VSDNSFPGLDEIYGSLNQFCDHNADIAEQTSLGLTPEGREVRVVRVTDGTVPDDDKQVAMVVCGRHGSEWGTGPVGTTLLEWLAAPDAAAVRRNQVVFVVPVANPDGCVRKKFHAPPRHLSETEEHTIAALARREMPDAIVDVHSFGEDDADLEAIVTGNMSGEGDEEHIYYAVASRAIDGAAEAGYPFCLHHTEKRNEGYNNFIAGRTYQERHSLAFGMEVNHHVLSPDEAGESGAVAIRALLECGNCRWPWQDRVGYPIDVLKGDFAASIRPLGANAAARRKSRAAIWPDRQFFYVVNRTAPDERTVITQVGYSGFGPRAADHAFTFCCRVRGQHDSLSVTVDGQQVDARTFTDACSTFASIELAPEGKRDYEVVVRA
jgi:Zinc carboxypeptidase